LGCSPVERFAQTRDVLRPSPSSEALRDAFRLQARRRQRQSDGTISLEGVRFEVPARYRHFREVYVRYARWDLRRVDLIDPRQGTILAPLYPLDRQANADGQPRPVAGCGASIRRAGAVEVVEASETPLRCPAGAAGRSQLQLHRTGAARHGKSYFFSEFSPYATLLSGGQATKATLFYNNARKRVGIVGFWDAVAFDEVAGIKIRDPDAIQIMKDYMANGRFSRGVEVIADASMVFVGNIDHSIEQLVHSAQHDLFMTLPKEFDLAEAFHYQMAHTNRYEEVTKRIRLGAAVEGRDEKGIKKTVCGLLKILHPDGPPAPAEFAEYVAYAVECRRRVKEQMNKRKPDDEFANIGLSYFTANGEEIVVYCPESKEAEATQQPVRQPLAPPADQPPADRSPAKRPKAPVEPPPVSADRPAIAARLAEIPPDDEPKEQHFTIMYGDTGRSYESIIGPYLKRATEAIVEAPYIRLTHQVQNFVRFCVTVVKLSAIKRIRLVTGYDDETQLAETKTRLDELAQSLLEIDIVLDVKLNRTLHDREIRLDNGWFIKIGRGLDFYQKPASLFELGANDLSLRKCLETKVDIFRGG